MKRLRYTSTAVFDKYRDCPNYGTIVSIFDRFNYRMIRNITDANVTAPEHHFEFWGGEKGVMILQLWKDKNGIGMYADFPIGHTIPDLINALFPKDYMIGRAMQMRDTEYRVMLNVTGPGHCSACFEGEVIESNSPLASHKVGNKADDWAYSSFFYNLEDL